jgi:Domain of unknown function (DUF4258)
MALVLVFGTQLTPGPGGIGAPAVPAAPASVSAAVQLVANPSRPRYVAGYTLHAKLRMSQRGYSTTTVENCIKYGPNGIYQGDGTWKVSDDYPITVVINSNAYIVTVY